MHRGWVVTGIVAAAVVVVTAFAWADAAPDFRFRSQQVAAIETSTHTRVAPPRQPQNRLRPVRVKPPAVPVSDKVPRSVALAELARWDQARAQAWATGNTRALRALYAPGTEAGRQDLRLLRRYLGRGLRVEGMQMQVLAVEELTVTQRRLQLRVTDRLVGAVAVDAAGARQPLPQSLPRTRTLTLIATESGWQMAAVHGE